VKGRRGELDVFGYRFRTSDLTDRLILIAHGDNSLVDEAIAASAAEADGVADLKKVVDYIVARMCSRPAVVTTLPKW